MIKLKTHLKEFESVIKIIGKISQETDYDFTAEGIKVRAVDTSGTYLGIFNIKKEMFDEYELEKDTIITISNELFGKLVKKVGKKELWIDFTEDEIVLSNPKEKFSLKYFVGQRDERPDPTPNCTSVWKMKSDEFTKIISEMETLGVICCLDGAEELTMKMKSNMVKGEVITTAEKIQSEDCFCFYDLGMMAPMVECKNIFKELRVGFGPEVPCVVKGTNDYLNFLYVVAPRVE